MIRFNKKLAGIVAVAMIVALTACEKGSESVSDGSNTTTATTTAVTTANTAETTTSLAEQEDNENTDGQDFSSLAQEKKIKLLGYDGIDIENPNSEFDKDTVYEFYAWYVSDRYGFDLTFDEIEEVIDELTEEFDFEVPRFHFICVAYGLYPSPEMREEGYFWSYIEPMEFGDEPILSIDDTEDIPDEYYQ